METSLDVLRAIAAGAERPTHIMYKANLSWGTMQQYIRQLLRLELLAPEVSEGKTLYKLSQKGFNLLRQYLSIREELRAVSFGEGI